MKKTTTKPQTDEDVIAEAGKHTALVVRPVTTLTITTPTEYERAAGLLKVIKTEASSLDELRRSMTRPLDEAKRKIMDLFRTPQQELDGAERKLKGTMIDFENAERRRLAEERAAQEAAAEKERARLLKLAATAEKKGQGAKATALTTMAESPMEVVEAEPTRVAGISTRTLYHAEVTDFAALVAAVAGGMPLSLLLPNQKALDALARASKDGELTIPGVSVRSEQSMAAGR